MGFALALHVLAATVWVGGMFFALVALRPAAAALPADARLRLSAATLTGFFHWVWTAAAVLLVTGLWMVLSVLGGFRAAGLHVHLMFGLGVLMMLLAAHVWFAPLRRLRLAAAGGHWTEAGRYLAQIRLFMGLSLALGLAVVALAAGGRYWFR